RPFDAVILDLTVPGALGGKETMLQLLNIDPKVRGIVCSGYSSHSILGDFANYGFKGAVVKPYRIAELGLILKEIIS
ncbi:MAG: hypothetical protein OEV64_10525, partial [Desulfobulbaceae bacterium]|nr:hypothetical protein [Desulfobulbaceae bacterium]